MHVLDIGAGPGTITADLAELVDTIVSTEISDEALALSREHVASRGLSTTTAHRRRLQPPRWRYPER